MLPKTYAAIFNALVIIFCASSFYVAATNSHLQGYATPGDKYLENLQARSDSINNSVSYVIERSLVDNSSIVFRGVAEDSYHTILAEYESTEYGYQELSSKQRSQVELYRDFLNEASFVVMNARIGNPVNTSDMNAAKSKLY